MFDPETIKELKNRIADCIGADQGVLDTLRAEIKPLRSATRRIQPRATTSISVVGTDGGNNQLQFDPFLIQIIRVVDSSDNEYCLEAISPTAEIATLDRHQFTLDGAPRTALGEMMSLLGLKSLTHLSHMIRPSQPGRPVSPSWVQAYRELVEWSILLSILKKDFGTDTLIVSDGLLRSKVFAGDYFPRLMKIIEKRVELQWERNRRRVYLAGIAKHSKVLTRYRLAMALEGVLQTDYPAYAEVPREVEEKAYVWSEFARRRSSGRGRRDQQICRRKDVPRQIRFPPLRSHMAGRHIPAATERSPGYPGLNAGRCHERIPGSPLSALSPEGPRERGPGRF